MKEDEKTIEFKLSKVDEFMIDMLIYNTALRLMGFPEDYTITQFDTRLWPILIVNIMAMIVFGGTLLWSWRKERNAKEKS